MTTKNRKQIARERENGLHAAAGIGRGKGAALIAGLVLWLILGFAYAGPKAPAAFFTLIIEGGVLLLWLVAAIGIGLLVLPLFRLGDSQSGSRLLHLITAGAFGLGTLSLLTLLLGLLGWLNQIVAIALVAEGVLIALFRVARLSHTAAVIRAWLAEPAGWGWLGLLVIPFAAVMTVGAMLPPYLLWNRQEPHGYDVVEYHLQVPREWFEAGRIVPLHHNVFSFFPFNVEMHYLLAMHLRGGPWAGMYLAQFMHGAFIVLTVLAACGFARRRVANRFAPLIVALAMAATPLLTQLGAIAYDEGGFLLFGTLAIGWAMLGVRESEHRTQRFALAGVMAGFACGSKLTAVPEALLAVAVVSTSLLFIIPAARKDAIGKRLTAVVTFGLLGLICFAPWLIRTWAWSGNPVFPELPQLGHGHFSQVQIERWHRAHTARPDQQSVRGRLKAAWFEILANWQFGFPLIPLAVIAAFLDYRNPDVWFLGAMLFLLAVFWLGFTHLQGRFFVLAIPICALLIARLSWPALPVLAAQAVTAIVLLNLQFLAPKLREITHEALGSDDLGWLTISQVQAIPTNASLALVGDAKAFLYQTPMSRLSYRTIFDADTTTGDVIEAWAGPRPKDRVQWLLIDPAELERFEKTYQPFPPLPPSVTAHSEPFVVER